MSIEELVSRLQLRQGQFNSVMRYFDGIAAVGPAVIRDKDREGWIGASDTARVMGCWNTAAFETFWSEELGLYRFDEEPLSVWTGVQKQTLHSNHSERFRFRLFVVPIKNGKTA